MTDNANSLQNIQKISTDAPKDKDSRVHEVRIAKSDEDGNFKKIIRKTSNALPVRAATYVRNG